MPEWITFGSCVFVAGFIAVGTSLLSMIKVLYQYDWTLDNLQSQGCRQKCEFRRKSHEMGRKSRKNGPRAIFFVGSRVAN